MKFKKDCFVISYELYPFHILISSQNKKEFKKSLKQVLPKNNHGEISLFDGEYRDRTVMFTGGQTAIHFRNPSHGHIGHEVFHAVCFLFNHIGIEYSSQSEEAFAYTIQFVTDKIYKMVED